MRKETRQIVSVWVLRLWLASGIALIVYHADAFGDLFFLLSMR